MHRSRFRTAVIDCRVEDLEEAGRFWAAALGCELGPPLPGLPTTYRTLRGRDDLLLLVQKVDHESRVHLDIDSDDVEAEVMRLEALGARRVAKVRDWWILEAPTGHRFCVVPTERPLGDANEWP